MNHLHDLFRQLHLYLMFFNQLWKGASTCLNDDNQNSPVNLHHMVLILFIHTQRTRRPPLTVVQIEGWMEPGTNREIEAIFNAHYHFFVGTWKNYHDPLDECNIGQTWLFKSAKRLLGTCEIHVKHKFCAVLKLTCSLSPLFLALPHSTTDKAVKQQSIFSRHLNTD